MTTTPQIPTASTDLASLETSDALGRVSLAPVLITEQQVVLSTAAAASVLPATPHRHWPGAELIAAIRHIHIALPQPRPSYPRHDASYFESARLSRLMEHL